jgi:hypothetical protein
MGLTDDEIQNVLRTKREMERRLAETQHLIDPETVRMVREQQELARQIIEPAVFAVARERAALIDAVGAPQVAAVLEERSGMNRVMQQIAESVSVANVALSRSVFATEFVEGIQRIAAEHQAAAVKLDAAVMEVAKRFQPMRLDIEVGRLVEMFKPIDLTRFAENFRYVEEITRAAELVLGSVRLESLGDLIGVTDPAGLQLGTVRLNTSYARLTKSAASAPKSTIEAPFMAQVPALAVYSQARFMRSITTHDADEPVIEIWSGVQVETTAVIETTLPLVNPALLTSWKGGLATARRRGDDWVRQAASSLRYVLITTLDTLAPKASVLADRPDRKHLSDKGAPNRTAQVHWLCRSFKNKTYRRMVISDLESALDIIDTMNEAVHREDYQEIEDAFDRMCVRAEIALRHVLEIYRIRG